MKHILIHVMYRDACNYKSHAEFYFTNDKGIDFGEIQELIQPIMDDPIMVQDYGIPSIAPLDNEFTYAQGDDHAYCEITELEEVDPILPKHTVGDINDVLELIISPDRSRQRARLVDARDEVSNNLDDILKKLMEE